MNSTVHERARPGALHGGEPPKESTSKIKNKVTPKRHTKIYYLYVQNAICFI